MSFFQVNTPLPHIPDDLTIPQFMLREASGRPTRPRNVPFFIDDGTGRAASYEEVSVSVGMRSKDSTDLVARSIIGHTPLRTR